MTDVSCVLSLSRCVPGGFAGLLWGPLQPHHSLRSAHLLQLGAQTALQEHLLLLPSAHVQAEGRAAALRGREAHHGDLQIHPHLQLRRVRLNYERRHAEPSEQPPWLLLLWNTASWSRSRTNGFNHRHLFSMSNSQTPHSMEALLTKTRHASHLSGGAQAQAGVGCADKHRGRAH